MAKPPSQHEAGKPDRYPDLTKRWSNPEDIDAMTMAIQYVLEELPAAIRNPRRQAGPKDPAMSTSDFVVMGASALQGARRFPLKDGRRSLLGYALVSVQRARMKFNVKHARIRIDGDSSEIAETHPTGGRSVAAEHVRQVFEYACEGMDPQVLEVMELILRCVPAAEIRSIVRGKSGAGLSVGQLKTIRAKIIASVMAAHRKLSTR